MASRMTKAEQATLIQEQAELIEELRALLHAQNEAKADEAIEKASKVDETIVAQVNRRINEYGDVLNIMINPEYEGSTDLRVIAKALRTTLAPRSRRRTDKEGRTWMDVYPAISRPAEVTA